MRRPPGTGTIERWRGRHRARLPYTREILDVFDTPEEADRALEIHLTTSRAPSGDSLKAYAEPGWLDRRRRSRPKSFNRDRDRWRAHVEAWECYEWPMREIRRGDVRRWVDGVSRTRADQTARNALNLLRVCLRDALDDELIPANVAVGVRVHPRGTTRDTWTYLRPAELEATIAAAPRHLRAMVAFAVGTGLRWSEQRMLRLEDVDLTDDAPHVTVRRSANGSTKNGRVRVVPLFGVGLAGARALVALVAGRRNPGGLLCLPPRGEAYIGANGPRLDAWAPRHVRWHDLRHTCASALVAGTWGPAWPLMAVRDFLGHSSVTITERYAHLAGSVVEDAAAVARSHPGATTDLDKCLSHLRNSNPGPTVYETAVKRSEIRALRPKGGTVVAPSGNGASCAPPPPKKAASRG